MNFTNILIALGALTIVLATAVVVIARDKLKRSGTSMAAGEFFVRMLRKARYDSIGPATLQRRLEADRDRAVIVDLRAPESYARGHIVGAVPHQFDDFLKAVVVDGAYDEYRENDRQLILVCDTGKMSRVAGEILAEDEGFSKVVNLRGGMRRWDRWQEKLRAQESRCCRFASLLSCCPVTSSKF